MRKLMMIVILVGAACSHSEGGVASDVLRERVVYASSIRTESVTSAARISDVVAVATLSAIRPEFLVISDEETTTSGESQENIGLEMKLTEILRGAAPEQVTVSWPAFDRKGKSRVAKIVHDGVDLDTDKLLKAQFLVFLKRIDSASSDSPVWQFTALDVTAEILPSGRLRPLSKGLLSERGQLKLDDIRIELQAI